MKQKLKMEDTFADDNIAIAFQLLGLERRAKACREVFKEELDQIAHLTPLKLLDRIKKDGLYRVVIFKECIEPQPSKYKIKKMKLGWRKTKHAV